MRHEHTSQMYTYWNRLRGRFAAPERSAIEPSDIREILKDTFILDVDTSSCYTFRLAGTRICSLFRKELKTENLLDLFDPESAEALQTLLINVCTDHSVSVISLIGTNDRGDTMPLEILLLPLRFNGKTNRRILGSLVPLTMPVWLASHPLAHVRLSGVRLISQTHHRNEMSRPLLSRKEQANVVPMIIKGARQVKHLQVLDGGNLDPHHNVTRM